jgi:hypothetical protein
MFTLLICTLDSAVISASRNLASIYLLCLYNYEFHDFLNELNTIIFKQEGLTSIFTTRTEKQGKQEHTTAITAAKSKKQNIQ